MANNTISQILSPHPFFFSFLFIQIDFGAPSPWRGKLVFPADHVFSWQQVWFDQYPVLLSLSSWEPPAAWPSSN